MLGKSLFFFWFCQRKNHNVETQQKNKIWCFFSLTMEMDENVSSTTHLCCIEVH